MNSRGLRYAGPAILAIVAIVAAVWALAYGGGADPLRLGDPGGVVRWGLPVAKLVVNLGAAVMVGALVLALYALQPATRPFEVALNAASAGAAVFTVAAGTVAFLTFANVIGAAPSADAQYGEQLGRFLIEQEAGRSWLITTLAGAVVTVLAFVARGWTSTLLVALLAIASLVPMATQGHSGDEANHNAAVMALVLHIIAAAVWLGGVLLLVLVRPLLTRDEMVVLVTRYSTLALVAFAVVAISGLARATAGDLTPATLLSPYGVILLVKVAALIALGVLGAMYRIRVIRRMGTDAAASGFWWLVTLELALMGLASGAAAALARTAPPVDTTLPPVRTPAEFLTGAPLPPELTPERWITAWEIDLLWAVAIGFGAFFYLAGVARLRRRGDAWPVHRSVLWLLGLAALLWVTCGAPNVYQDVLFSVHMTGHMLLTMAIPLCLVAAFPVTLAARAIRKRNDGTRGGREWILWAVHSPFGRVVTHPAFAAAMFVGSLWVFYFTDLFRWTLYDHVGHEWMVAHFVITGYLFVLSLLDADPIPYRASYPFRLLTLIGVMALHAFFGIAIMMQSGLLVAEWFGSMGRTWGATPLEDQYTGGGIAWGVGEIPTLILATAVAIMWSRSDERLQRRRDRQTDRTGDTELDDYNARLAALAARDARTGRR